MIAGILIVASLHGEAILAPAPPNLLGGPGEGLLAAPLSQAEALERLPLESKDSLPPLPVWARMLAGTLPRAAAGLLQLDYAQRTHSPLDPKLRAAMRFVAAQADGCEYAQAYALADAARAGLVEAHVKALKAGDLSGFSKADRAALEFARAMSVASSSVTDEQFASLVKQFDEKKAAAMVMLLAYSNFQDRLLICLGAEVEEGGPQPAPEVTVLAEAQAKRNTPPPPRDKTPLPKPTGQDAVSNDGDWSRLDSYEELQTKLERQRRRSTRLPVPTWEQVERGLPPGTLKPTKIVWYLITMGYVPELGIPFEHFMRTAGAEVSPKYDRLFAGALFWVVTKAIDCPYCMGHCEMNWEVAGLSQNEIAERSKLLAGDDWSSFPPEQQRAFAFARKLTQAPSAVDDKDIATLKADLGPDLALIVALSASRYNYMTRISNGFQLTLESENVFFDYYGVPKPEERPAATPKL